MFSLAVALALAASPPVAIISSRGTEAELRFQPLGSATLAPVVARFSHREGSSVAGAVVPGTRTVVVTATVDSTPDTSFASGLIRLREGQPAQLLVRGVAVGSRPLVTPEGRVFVARGIAGPLPEEGNGQLRTDWLTVDEVSLTDGATRSVYETRGYVTHLAGALNGELIIYEVGTRGARLLAVHIDTLAVRTVLAAMAPLAHDFTVDVARKRIVYTQGDPLTRRWFARAVDVSSGASVVLAEGPEVTLLPTVFPDGRVAVSGGAGRGLAFGSVTRALSAQGAGFERIRVFSEGVAVGLHERPGDFPVPFAVRLNSQSELVVVAPRDARIDIAGLVP